MSLTRIGRYTLKEELGRGGMARVVRAYDEALRREAAIKLIRVELSAEDVFRRRFVQEARVVASLEQLAVVAVYDYGEVDGQLYLVMPLMRGGSLAELIAARKAANRPFSLEEVIVLLERIAPTLDAIHRRGVVHRDLKPSNILFDDRGEAYIADFGIAHVQQATELYSKTGESYGTPAYSSPEQIRGERALDGRSDLYALGIIVFEMLAGQTPYYAERIDAWVYQHVYAPIPDIRTVRASLPPILVPFFHRALAKNPAERYATARAMLSDLEQVVRGGNLSITPGGTEEAVLPPWWRRTSLQRQALGAVVLVLTLLGFIVGVNLFAEEGTQDSAGQRAPTEAALVLATPTIITVTAQPSSTVSITEDVEETVAANHSPTATTTVVPSSTKVPTPTVTGTATPDATATWVADATTIAQQVEATITAVSLQASATAFAIALNSTPTAAPTVRPTVPTLTSCTIAVDNTFSALWQTHAALAGCPRAARVRIATIAEQVFEGGASLLAR